ncbi:hypothetical protein BE221DRAFT_75187 [Ostreococcus tauri]|uniref:Uncharacterized protein n=1 Tax=Ostreococcus tauri TaxID=70448 RepID=A0A1Y5I9N4_OSTTA|nr:hypothetical protein BE221DRAFT_75187 [Ostreococcus tauri]
MTRSETVSFATRLASITVGGNVTSSGLPSTSDAQNTSLFPILPSSFTLAARFPLASSVVPNPNIDAVVDVSDATNLPLGVTHQQSFASTSTSRVIIPNVRVPVLAASPSPPVPAYAFTNRASNASAIDIATSYLDDPSHTSLVHAARPSSHRAPVDATSTRAHIGNSLAIIRITSHSVGANARHRARRRWPIVDRARTPTRTEAHGRLRRRRAVR